MKPQHCIITRKPESGWLEPKATFAHVEVQFGPDNIARTTNGNSECLPIECADAANAYPAVFDVKVRDGAAQLVLPPGGQQGFLKTSELADPPTFDLLYQVHGIDPEPARAIYDFQKLLARFDVWPYGRKPPVFEVIFADEIQALQEAGPEMGQREIVRLNAQVAALEAQLDSAGKAYAELGEAYNELVKDHGKLNRLYTELRPELDKAAAAPIPDTGVEPDPPPQPTTREARTTELEAMGAEDLRAIIRGHDIKGAASKSEMRGIILNHEFPEA